MNDTFSRMASVTATTLLVWASAGAALSQERVSLTDIADRLANIEASTYVPFKVQIGGGVCNSAAVGSANPAITINSDASDGTFTVTSILMKTDDIPITGFEFLAIISLFVDGTRYDTKTPNLTGSSGGSGVLESFDIMGTPVALSGDLNSHTPAASFPHQIVADSAGNFDIRVEFFCRSDDEDLNILNVSVSGWKRTTETITVTYTPGS